MISIEAQRQKRRCSANHQQRPWGLVIAALLIPMTLFATASTSGGESKKSKKEHVNLFDMDGMRHVTSRLSPAIVKLNPSGNCKDCIALEEFWELMGQQSSSNHGLSVMWEVNCEVAPLVCSQFPIRTGHPTMVGWTGRAFTAPFNGPKDLEGLYKWIQSVFKLAEQPQQQFRDVVANSANNIVNIPDDKSFFIRFDGAGGCESCRQLDPYWNHLSDEHPNAGVGVVIDCAAQPQFCAATDVVGMVRPGQPSFAYYTATAEDGGKLDWFNGPRSVYGLSHWVESLVGKPDDGMQIHRNFDGIYARNSWVKDTGVDSKGSGTGSALEGNELYMDFITSLIRPSSKNKKNIQSIVDVGCGDFNLMQHVVVNGGGKTYHGYDVSKIAVERARMAAVTKQQQAATATTNITFTVSEPFQEYEPADLLIVKDVLQHLPLEDAISVVNQLHKFRYAVIVNDLDPSLPNVDVDYKSGLPMVAGGYRSLDVQQAPFHLKCAQWLDLHPHLHSLIPNSKKITCLVERNDDDRDHDGEL